MCDLLTPADLHREVPGESVKVACVLMAPGMTRPECEEVVRVEGTSHESAGQAASVLVALAASRIEAELIAGMLRSNGVRAVVSADDAGGLEPQLQIQGVRVLVAPSDETAARRLLVADDAP